MASDLAKTQGQGGAIEVHVGKHPLSEIVNQQLWKTGQLQQIANVAFPITALDSLPPMHVPSLTVLSVDPDSRKGKDVYFITGDQLGLSKHVILKMLSAAGAHVKTRKESPDSDLDHIRYTAIVWGRLPDGTMHTEQSSKFWSWEKQRESSIRKALKQPGKTEEDGIKAALQYREFADEQTETKAILRAARAFLSIRTSYSPAELQKPFVFARSVPQLDMSDPEVRRAYQMKMIDSMVGAYGPDSSTPALAEPAFRTLTPDPEEEDYDDEPETEAAEVAPLVEAEPVEDYDPLSEESPAQTEAEISEELNKSIVELCRKIPRDVFSKIIQKNGVTGNLREASVDMKIAVKEDIDSYIAGRLKL